MNAEDALKELLDDLLGIWGNLVDPEILLGLVEGLLEVDLIGHPVADVIRDLLDVELSVAEDCLHLAVSTPQIPG